MRNWNAALRSDLCARAAQYAAASGAVSYQSRGAAAVTLFPRAADDSSHGNFHPQSFAAIWGNEDWKPRLDKPHPQRKRALPAPHDKTARELDSCTSSDALLMNIACYPGAITGRIAQLLGVAPGAGPAFGAAGKVPLDDGALDSTEVDMRLGDTNVEAKLTESDFTCRPVAHVERYVDLYDVFEADALPRDGDEYLSYQLIRNVLAIVRRPEAKFRVLLDARRPDLLREWWVLYGAIRRADLRRRCGFILWQELAAAAPAPLREFLAQKYGL